MHETPIILSLSEKEVQQIVEVPSCCLGRPLQLLTPGDKKLSYVTARDTQTAERRHTKRTFIPTSKVLHAEGRTDKHMCYLTVQTPVC
jgi:hypothetical protein